MDTERPSPRYTGIDVWEPLDALDAMIDGQLAAVAAVRAARRQILEAALAMETRLQDGGRLVYAGAGTSGRLAVQDGAELMPTFSWPEERLLLLLAGGEEAMVRAVEGAEDEIEHAAELIRRHAIAPKDVLIAVAASGATPFTLSCLREAKRRGALTIGVANNRDAPLLAEAERPIYLETGSEPIAGSTRMNAGTAQRITLSLLSSLTMVRLGRVYAGLMVEVQAVNAKLVGRREKMLVHLTGKSLGEVREALHKT
ncbi:MAG: N-acetylmuramic acid 6-phosphate etherase, partial [Rhodomicrobium sp.]